MNRYMQTAGFYVPPSLTNPKRKGKRENPRDRQRQKAKDGQIEGKRAMKIGKR